MCAACGKSTLTPVSKDQPEYQPLPVHVTSDGTLTSCWKLSWKERLKVLFTGKVYCAQLTFGRSLQPQLLGLDPPSNPKVTVPKPAAK